MSVHKISFTPLSKTNIATNHSSKKQIVLFLASFSAVIGLFGVIVAGYFVLHTYTQNKTLAKKVQTLEYGGTVAGAKTKVVADEVLKQIAEATRSRVEGMVLIPPSDDTPKFAQIDDLSKVPKEPFFRDVQMGDHLLIYQKLGIAILFRPSANKIITMTYLNGGNQAAVTEQSQPQGQPVLQQTQNETLMRPPQIPEAKVTAGLEPDVIDKPLLTESPLPADSSPSAKLTQTPITP